MANSGRGKLGVVRECAALLRDSSSESNTTQILATLDRLKAVRVTPNVLRKTEVGKLINSKALLHHADVDVRQRSSALVASWRAIVKEATRTGTPSGPELGTLGIGKRVSASSSAPADAGSSGEPAGRRRRLGASAPSLAGSIGQSSTVSGSLASLAAGAAMPPLAYEGRDASRAATASGPSSGPVPRTVPVGTPNRYAPDGTRAATTGRTLAAKADAASSGAVGSTSDPRSAAATGDAASSTAGAGSTSGPRSSAAGGSGVAAAVLAALADEDSAPPAARGYIGSVPSSSCSVPAASSGGSSGARGGPSSSGISKIGQVKVTRESPKIDLAGVLSEVVPYPTERPGSGGRRNHGGAYFCYENYHTGSCIRGDSCPFPHWSGGE